MVWLGLALAWPVLAEPPGPLPLWAPAEPGPPSAALAGPAHTRTQWVRLNPAAANLGQGSRASLTFDLFGQPHTARLTRAGPVGAGSAAWIGRLEGEPFSTVVLAEAGGTLSGSIHTGQATYVLRPAGDGLHTVQALDVAALPPDGEPLAVSLPAGEAASIGGPSLAAASAGGETQVDVLVVFTPGARAQVEGPGGPGAMLSLVALAVAEANAAYANSGVPIQLRLVHAAEVDYTESGDFTTDLNRLRDHNDPWLNEVHHLRNLYGADLVSLLVKSGPLCGIAFQMSQASAAFESAAFSVVAHNCATGYYSFAHELGHNMGSQHDRPHAPLAGAYSYSYGYRHPGSAFRTIMAYNCATSCPRVPYFSNPQVEYQSQPTGIDEPPSEAAHNALSLANTAAVVANFRPSQIPDGQTPPPGGTVVPGALPPVLFIPFIGR